MIALLLFAQSLESLSGGAGWVGAGLLGGVLAWLLFFHLPAKDKQIEAMIRNKDEQMGSLMIRHDAIMTETRKDFKESLATVVAHCEKEFATLRGNGGRG